ncbi:MAG: hypothetical protein EOS70_30410 [Mesorhizobium sp.]|uniref:hypothetical protein n=1 Tax=Mesorhizobium sp. TaxID=1871066 RepID=UPI000FE521D1|nr:hypothetical protein [Mesorhizobium sp.]RWC27077.1 MAG: hypothetical protein EOS70_30410 [Mesorhizobium sp.]
MGRLAELTKKAPIKGSRTVWLHAEEAFGSACRSIDRIDGREDLARGGLDILTVDKGAGFELQRRRGRLKASPDGYP